MLSHRGSFVFGNRRPTIHSGVSATGVSDGALVEAHRFLESNEQIGKIIVTVD
jgi:hypothetical protein